MSAQWAQFLRVTFTLLMLTCAQSAALVLMSAQAAQFQNKLQINQTKIPKVTWGFFVIYIAVILHRHRKNTPNYCISQKKVVTLHAFYAVLILINKTR
jgi:hypothetical protein